VAEREVRAALARLRGVQLLHGARGRPPADVAALVATILQFSDLCLDAADEVDEIDVNPLIVSASGVCAVDALIVPAKEVQAADGAT